WFWLPTLRCYCCAACPMPRPWGPQRPSARRLRSRPSASPSCSGGKWRARSSTKPTLHASWSPSSAQGGTSRVERDRRMSPLAAMFLQPRHDLDEIAGTVAVVELPLEDLAPRILAGARRPRQAEDVGAAREAGARARLDRG